MKQVRLVTPSLAPGAVLLVPAGATYPLPYPSGPFHTIAVARK